MDTSTTVPAATAAGVAVAEALIPGAMAFDPLLELMLTAIRAHYNATKTWPTPDELNAALPVGWQKLQTTWAAWKPSGDGSFGVG